VRVTFRKEFFLLLFLIRQEKKEYVFLFYDLFWTSMMYGHIPSEDRKQSGKKGGTLYYGKDDCVSNKGEKKQIIQRFTISS